MRVGIIGAGLHAIEHLEGYRRLDNVTVTAIADTVAGRAAEMAKRFGIAETHDSHLQLIASENIDFIDIVTPPGSHFEIAKACLATGKPLICEKPLSLDPAEAREMARLAERSGANNFTAFQRRYDPVIATVRELIGSGVLGDLVLVNTSIVTNWGALKASGQATGHRQWLSQASTGGGFLNGALPHYIDLLHHLFGDIDRVNSSRGSVSAGPRESAEVPDDILLVSGAFKESGLFSISATWSAGQPTGERWEVVGTRRSLVIAADGTLSLTSGNGGLEKIDVSREPAALWLGATNGGYGFGNADRGFAAMVADIDHALRNGAGSRCATFSDGLKAAEVIAFIRAVDTAQPVGRAP
jgi:predicted dehydrogenase